MTAAGPTDEQILRDPIGLAERGENPTALARLESGWVVFGMTQLLPGYCVLLAVPEVRELNDLDHDGRARFLRDMVTVGDVIRAECQPLRLNYEILGNDLTILHAHVRPRHRHEPAAHRSSPSYSYGRDAFRQPEHSWRRPGHRAMMERLRAGFARLDRCVTK
jgi:diadenosine tetraphosphate (Ap4A) HIT family hydrolase